MRKLLGCLVLFGGVGALGYLAPTTHMTGIQEGLTEDARAFAAAQSHPLQVVVSGRDVRVSGTVNDATEYAAVLTGFEGLNGIRVVNFNDVATLPVANPYTFTATQGADGTLTVAGVVPNDAAGAMLGGLSDGQADLTLAAGVPDADWADHVAAGLAVVRALEGGQMVVTGREFVISGTAQRPTDRDAAFEPLAGLGADYTLIDRVEVLDDGQAFRLSAELSDSAVNASGKFPADLPNTVITDRFVIDEDLEIDRSVILSPITGWGDSVATGLDALSGLIDGTLTIEEAQITLAGVGSPDGIAQAEALLAALPAPFTVTTDLSVYGADFDLRLDMDWDGSLARARGTYPLDFALRGPAGVAVDNVGSELFLPDEQGVFTANAAAGVTALGVLNGGSVSVTEDRIMLTGTATSPQVEAVLDSVFASLSDRVEITRDITYLDDGSPAAWALDYVASDGATVQGRVPTGMRLQDLSDALGISVTGAPATALTDTDSTGGIDALSIAAAYLPELETLSFARDQNGSALDVTLSPGVDLDLVAVDLAERLPTDVAFSISSLDELPVEGATRINAATGLSEVFRQGFWLPNLNFTADPDGCTAQADTLLERARINFLSGSARLDAASIRAINGLAAVAQICADADLVLGIGGHTDATGPEDDNQDLSFARATAVLTALEQRGVPRSSMIASGFGSSQPIADNDTEEGRAANRRTTLTFSDPLTP